MYQWPKNIREEIFIGLSVEGIYFSENTHVLHFTNNVTISVFNNINGKEELFNLASIIGKSVKSFKVIAKNSINIEFENKIIIKIDGSDDNYECYRVAINCDEFVV